MKSYLVQVRLGGNFADISVTASNEREAAEKAFDIVQADSEYAIFRHRYARYSV